MTTRMNDTRKAPTLLLLTSLTLLVPPVGALAQPTTALSGSTHARIRYQEGFVTVSGRGGSRTGAALGLNAPVTAGQQIATAVGRVELQLAGGSLARMDRGTVLEALTLSDVGADLERRNWFRLLAGTAFLHVEGLHSANEFFRIDTRATSVHFLTEGIFRIDTSGADGRTTVSVHSGVAEVVSQGISVLVRSGERTHIAPGIRPRNPRPFNAFSQDEFDLWNRARQAAYVKPYRNLPAREVPDEVRPFVTELAYYGEWFLHPRHGWVWYPAASAQNWSPYRAGRWDYGLTGWVWVSDEPWGWAPYHFGRWERDSRPGWFWIPGSAYAGAWVSWAWGSGKIGWCPLDSYNRPAAYVDAPQHGVDPAWVIVPLDRIHEPALQEAAISPGDVSPDELQALTGPPREHPERIAARVGDANPPRGTRFVALHDPGERVSFRTLEGRGLHIKEDRRVDGDHDRGSSGADRPAAPPRIIQTSGDPAAGSGEPGPGRPPLIPGLRTVVTAPAEGSYDEGRQPARGVPDRTAAADAETDRNESQLSRSESSVRIIPMDDRRGILRRMFLVPGVVVLPPVAPAAERPAKADPPAKKVETVAESAKPDDAPPKKDPDGDS